MCKKSHANALGSLVWRQWTDSENPFAAGVYEPMAYSVPCIRGCEERAYDRVPC